MYLFSGTFQHVDETRLWSGHHRWICNLLFQDVRGPQAAETVVTCGGTTTTTVSEKSARTAAQSGKTEKKKHAGDPPNATDRTHPIR